MLGNQFMQVKHALQAAHDLLRATGFSRTRFVINGKTFHPIYIEQCGVQYEGLDTYKVVLSRINSTQAWRDEGYLDNAWCLENQERFIVIDKEFRKIKGWTRTMLVEPSGRLGWYHARKKVFGFGDTLEKAYWLYNRRLKHAVVAELTAAA